MELTPGKKDIPDKKGPNYYPFGLTMAGISDKALKTPYPENKYRLSGKELQNKEFADGSGLEEYDFGARFQDPQLGKLWSIDPMGDKMPNVSPYAYVFNNPMRFREFDGLIPIEVFELRTVYHSSKAGFSSKENYYQVKPTIAGFLSGALGISKDAILNTHWVAGGVPSGYSAITLGRTVNFSDDDLNNNDVAYWVSEIGHESTHRDDIENQGSLSFYFNYGVQYLQNWLGRDESANDAYRDIETEDKAYSNEKAIDNFFADEKNSNDFFSILNNNKFSDTKKGNQLEALGIERVTIPGLNNLTSALNNTLGGLDSKKDAGLIKALNGLLNLINITISNDQKKVKSLRQ